MNARVWRHLKRTNYKRIPEVGDIGIKHWFGNLTHKRCCKPAIPGAIHLLFNRQGVELKISGKRKKKSTRKYRTVRRCVT